MTDPGQIEGLPQGAVVKPIAGAQTASAPATPPAAPAAPATAVDGLPDGAIVRPFDDKTGHAHDALNTLNSADHPSLRNMSWDQMKDMKIGDVSLWDAMMAGLKIGIKHATGDVNNTGSTVDQLRSGFSKSLQRTMGLRGDDTMATTGAEKVGGSVEDAMEFMAGDEVLKGLSMADRLRKLAPVAKVFQEFPRLAAAVSNMVRQGSVSLAQSEAKGSDNPGQNALETMALSGLSEAVPALSPAKTKIGGTDIPVSAAQTGVPGAKALETAAQTGESGASQIAKFGETQNKAAQEAVGSVATKTAEKAVKGTKVLAQSRDFGEAADSLRDAAEDLRSGGGTPPKNLDAEGQAQWREKRLARAKDLEGQAESLDKLHEAVSDSMTEGVSKDAKPIKSDSGRTVQMPTKQIDGRALLKNLDKLGDDELKKALGSDVHVKALRDLGGLLAKGQNSERAANILAYIRAGRLAGVAHPATLTGLLTQEGATGMLGAILTNPRATKALANGLRVGASAPVIADNIVNAYKD